MARHHVAAIIDSINRGQCVLCVSGRLDTGHSTRTLVEELLDELPDVDRPSAERVLKTSPLTAAAYVQNHLGDRFLPALAAAVRGTAVPSSIELLSELPFRSILTTSFGHAFERSLFNGSVYTAHDIPLLYLDNRERHLLKLLGDVKDPGTLIWTNREVGEVLADIERRSILEQVYDGCSFLLVGFAAEDPDFRLILEHVIGPATTLAAQHYAVLIDISAMEREELTSIYGIATTDHDDSLQFILELRTAMGYSGEEVSLPAVDEPPEVPISERLEASLARLEDSPDDQEALVELDELEQILRRTREYERLVDLYVGRVAIATVDAQRAELLRELSTLFEYEMDDLERAFRARLASFENALRLSAMPELMRLAAATGLWDELLGVLEDNLYELDPDDRGPALALMARMYDQHTDETARALDTATMALELDPEHREARSLRLRLLRALAQWEALIEALKGELELVESPVKRCEHLTELADLYENRFEDPARALDCYRQALDEDPWSPDARLAYEALLRRREGYGELMSSLERRIGMASLQEQVAIRRELAALCDQALGARVLAIRHYEDLRADAPADLEVLRALARLYEEKGSIKECIEVLSTLLGIVDDNQERAEICLEMAEKWRKLDSEKSVRECLEWALAYGGARADLYATLGQVYRESGDWNAAIDLSTRRAKSASADERARLYSEIGHIYEHQIGDLRCAIDAYLEVVDAVPGHGQALDELTRLYQAREAYDELVAVLRQNASHMPARDGVDLLHRAGTIAVRHLDDSEVAVSVFEQALATVPGHVPTVLSLLSVLCERAEFGRAAELAVRALPGITEPDARNSVRIELAAVYQQGADVDRAVDTYREVLKAEPGHLRAAAGLTELLWQRGSYGESVPMLRLLMDRAPETKHVLRLGLAAAKQGEVAEADRAFAEAARRAPEDTEVLDAYSQFLCDREDWTRARELARTMAGLHDGTLSRELYTELHYRLALCAARLGDAADARRHVRSTLAKNRTHRPALFLSLELSDNSHALLSAMDRLIKTARDEAEKAKLLGDIADIHFQRRNDPEEALSAITEALTYRPDDHLLLHKYLDVLLALEDWSQAMTVLDQLIDSERSPAVRAKYRYTAAMLRLDKFDDRDEATRLLRVSLDEDRSLVRSFAALEEILREDRAHVALKELYSQQIQHHGTDVAGEERAELARLWSALGQLCEREFGEVEEAILAYEVAVQLAPERQSGVHEALVPLYIQSGPNYLDKAIGSYHALLRADKGEVDHYLELQGLYEQKSDVERAGLCSNAARLLKLLASGRVPRLGTELILQLHGSAIDSAMWERVRHPELDRRLSTVFAIVVPVLVEMRARSLKKVGLDKERLVQPDDERRFAEIVRHVSRTLAVPLPATYECPQQEPAARLVACTTGRSSGLALALGDRVLSNYSEREVLFHLARHLVMLQPELMIASLISSAGDLADILSVVMAASKQPAETSDADSATEGSVSGKLLGALNPAARTRLLTLGAQFVDRNLDTLRACERWLQCATSTSLRVALALTGDITLCVRLLAAERPEPWQPGGDGKTPAHLVDLIWSSITDDVTAVSRQLRTLSV